MVENSQDLNIALTCADNADNAIWFSRAIGGYRRA